MTLYFNRTQLRLMKMLLESNKTSDPVKEKNRKDIVNYITYKLNEE